MVTTAEQWQQTGKMATTTGANKKPKQQSTSGNVNSNNSK